MVTLPMSLSDPYVPQTTTICTFSTASHIFVIGVVRNFRFGLQVNGSKFQLADVKPSMKGAKCGQGHVTHFTFYTP